MSLIPDEVKGTFQDILKGYADLQNVKMQVRLSRAAASAAAYDMPSQPKDPQSKSDVSTKLPDSAVKLSGGALVLAVGLGLLAVYLVVSK